MRQVTELLIDDIDGSEADETISFSLDGATYTIDLNKAHAAKLRDGLAPFVAKARRPSAPTNGRANGRGGEGRSGSSREESRKIREWAKGKGIEVNERGRIPGEVVKAYQEAARGPKRTQAQAPVAPPESGTAADTVAAESPQKAQPAGSGVPAVPFSA